MNESEEEERRTILPTCALLLPLISHSTDCSLLPLMLTKQQVKVVTRGINTHSLAHRQGFTDAQGFSHTMRRRKGACYTRPTRQIEEKRLDQNQVDLSLLEMKKSWWQSNHRTSRQFLHPHKFQCMHFCFSTSDKQTETRAVAHVPSKMILLKQVVLYI